MTGFCLTNLAFSIFKSYRSVGFDNLFCFYYVLGVKYKIK